MTGLGRLISVALTEAQVRDESKTETRRLGWWLDKNGRRLVMPGDYLRPCRKIMGRKPGEPLVIITRVLVTDVEREPLNEISQEGVAAEGFPDWTPEQFIGFFCQSMKCPEDRPVTVIRWNYPEKEATRG